MSYSKFIESANKTAREDVNPAGSARRLRCLQMNESGAIKLSEHTSNEGKLPPHQIHRWIGLYPINPSGTWLSDLVRMSDVTAMAR